VIVYAPAFALVALLRPNFRIAITLIIIVSAELAALIMVLLAQWPKESESSVLPYLRLWFAKT
jgi:hypothetical protein